MFSPRLRRPLTTRHPLRAAARAGLVVALLAPAACGSGSEKTAGGGDQYPTKGIEIMAPADPGGGWDLTARTLQKVVEQSRLSDNGVQVKNVPGAGGTVGLSQFATAKDEHSLMVMGLVMLGTITTTGSATKMDSVTPIARLTGEYEVLVVPAKSPYQTLDDFVRAVKADPKKVAIAGGPAGDVDQILAGLLAREIGVQPSALNYTGFEGGGAITPPLLSGEVAAGISGVSEFADQIRAGKLRALAVSSEKRLAVIDAPTFTEQGIDLTLANWRGIVAPKAISATEKQDVIDFIASVHGSEGWRKALIVNGWDDRYLAGEEFTTFIGSEQKRIDGVLTDLGLVKK
jgi:putative tricarboxylic transport membrane protein